MVDLKCPNCNATITLDDTREFGFCSYCGTKLQLVQKVKIVHEGTVNVAGIKTKENQLETAKKMLDIGEYCEAKKIYEKIVKESPDCGEAWLNLAFLKNKVTVSQFLSAPSVIWHQSERTPEQIGENMISNLLNCSELAKAKKLLDANYNDMIQSVIDRYKKEIRESFNRSQNIINSYKSNLKLLTTFMYDCESDYGAFGFEEYDGNICCVGRSQGNVVEINSSNQIVIQSYKIVEEGFFKIKKKVPQYSSIKIIFADGNGLYTSSGVMWKKR